MRGYKPYRICRRTEMQQPHYRNQQRRKGNKQGWIQHQGCTVRKVCIGVVDRWQSLLNHDELKLRNFHVQLRTLQRQMLSGCVSAHPFMGMAYIEPTIQARRMSRICIGIGVFISACVKLWMVPRLRLQTIKKANKNPNIIMQ